VSKVTEEEKKKKSTSKACFIASGTILVLWLSLLQNHTLDKLPWSIFYLLSAAVGAIVFLLIWSALENLFSVAYSRPRETVENIEYLAEKPEPSTTPATHDVRMEAVISKVKMTRKEKLFTLLTTVSGSLLLVDSAITYYLTSSSRESWFPFFIQLFVFYCAFSMIFFFAYFKKGGVEFPLRGKQTNIQVFAIKHKRKELIEILAVIFVLSTVFGELIVAKAIFNTPTPFGVIQGESMLPRFHEGDVLVIQGIDPQDIRIGDIIAFTPPSEVQTHYPPLVFHRVIDKTSTANGEILFQTKGDNNPDPEPFLTPTQNVHGVQRGLIPFIGWLFIFAGSYSGCFILLLFIAAAIIHQFLPRMLGRKRKPTE
jgi:signal peptidase